MQQFPGQAENTRDVAHNADLALFCRLQVPRLHNGYRPGLLKHLLIQALADLWQQRLDLFPPLGKLIVRPQGVLLKIPAQFIALLLCQRIGQQVSLVEEAQCIAA